MRGQVPRRELLEPLQQAGVTVHLIGGADVAARETGNPAENACHNATHSLKAS